MPTVTVWDLLTASLKLACIHDKLLCNLTDMEKYNTILHYTILPFFTILRYTILCFTITAVLYYPVLYYTILYYTILYYTIQIKSSYFWYTKVVYLCNWHTDSLTAESTKEEWVRKWLSVAQCSPWWHPSDLTSRCSYCPSSCWLCISSQWLTHCSSSKPWQTEAPRSSQQSLPWCKRWRSCGIKAESVKSICS